MLETNKSNMDYEFVSVIYKSLKCEIDATVSRNVQKRT